MVVSLLLGILVGAVLGLTGAGGGILAVPALVVSLGCTMQEAVPTALIAVSGSAAIGAMEGLRKGLVRYKAATLMVLCGVPVTSLGVSAAHALSQRLLLILFAGVMVIVAMRMLARARLADMPDLCNDSALACINPESGRIQWSWPTALLFAGIGGFTGFMTGLLGVGGGFIIVPLLRRYTNITMHGIVATSLMVIALIGSGGIVAAAAHGTTLPLQSTLWFASMTALGMLAGRRMAAHLSARHVQYGFATLLAAVAVGLLVKATLGM